MLFSHPHADTVVVSLSIVSHGQGKLIDALLSDLRAAHGVPFEILLTLNVPEDESFLSTHTDLPLTVIRNLRPKGFGANHNRAFEAARGAVFMVLNPDLRSDALDLAVLVDAATQDMRVGCVGPKIVDRRLMPSDSPRRFPTLARMARRVLLGRRGPEYTPLETPAAVEWVGGMFMVLRREVYIELGGFDERFFMYMEDVDLCRRLASRGYVVLFLPYVQVVHDARRQNRRNSRHLVWHLKSLTRYLLLYRVTPVWK